MKKNFLFAASALMLLGGCSQDEMMNAPQTNEDGKMAIVASIEGQPSSRVTESEGALSWEASDWFQVFSSNEVKFTTDATNAPLGKFTPEGNVTPNDNSYAVYYPVDNAFSLNAAALTVNLAATYSSGASIKAPMWGTYADASISFKHLCGALKVAYNDIPEGYTTLVVEASEPINGSFTATLTADEPILTTEAEVSEENKKVSVTITEGQDGVFYVPLPVGTYDLKVYAQKGNGTIELKSWSDLTIDRKGLYRTSATYVAVSSATTTPAAVSSAIANIGDNSVVDIEGTIDATTSEAGNMTLPDKNATYNFAATPTTSAENPLTFEEATGSDGAKVNINMPSDATGLYAVINTPNSTINIDGGTYESLTATTAENTLIIGKGVTVNSLIVKGGNVRVQGAVSAISRGDNADDVTYVIYEEGAQIPTSLGENIVAVSAAEWDLRKAIENATNSETVTLTEDVVLTKQLTITKSLTLDLAGHTIQNTTEIWNPAEGISHWSLISAQGENVAVTITGNGKVLSKENDCYAVDARNGATITIKDGTFNGNVTAVYVKFNGKAVIEGGEFKIQQLSESNDHRFLLNIYDKTDGSITVTGGTFQKFDPANSNGENPIANFVPAGYSSVADNEGYYTVSAGILNETALRSAISAAENNATITLGGDIILTSQLTINKSLTLDLAGHTIQNTTDIWNPAEGISHWSLISAQGENVAVTITGNGKVLSKENDCYAVDARNGATITIKDGTFNGNVTAVYVKFNGKAVIEGGEFKIQQLSESNDHRFLLNIYDKTDGSITVTGGTFQKFDPANSNGENPIANFVPEGYQSTTSDNGETYVVTASNEN